MYIKQVIIRGFKTYKEQTTLDEDFSPGTNVVVGFNGSGKSNFFQAILFVLSDQLSGLRAETRKALLHEGAGQAVLTAYVEVILDNSDRRVPVESDQVSIRRLIGVKKDDWLLDGKHATKAEIFGLLEGAGFAKTSPYYIVQQGKVSELTLMSDAQRLGLLKDISGAGVYDERRKESVKTMEDTAQRRTRTEGLIGEIQQKLLSLENEQKELRECEHLESRKRTLEYAMADREWRATQDRIEELTSRHDEASTKLVDLQGKVGALRKRSADADADVQQREEAKRVQEERLARHEAERDRAFEALTGAQLQADEESRRQRESEDQGASRLTAISKAREEVQAASAEIERQRPNVEQVESELRAQEERVQVSHAKRQELLAKQSRKQQFKTVAERNAALDEELRKRTTQLKEGRRKLEECGDKLTRAAERGAKATEEASTRRQELAAAERQLVSIGGEMRRLGESLDTSSEKMRLLHQERSRIDREVENFRKEALTSQHRLEATMPRAHRYAVTGVMRWAEEQGLQDRIRGPLLSHIEVSSTFRAAVESFAGMSLFNVLAMDDDVAAQAVKYVRTKRLGAVVVTPLSQLEVKQFNHVQMEGVKPLLDVVKCPAWALPAVQQIFGKAVVCRSMELCNEVARTHNVDAITVDGDRVSRRGIVTGGFQDPQRLVRLPLAESIRAAHKHAHEAEQRLPTMKEQIRSTSEQLDNMHAERRTHQEERDRVRAQMQGLTDQVQSLEAVTSKCNRDLSDLREWQHRMNILIGESEIAIESKKNERASKSLSGLSPADEELLATLTSELKGLLAQHELRKKQCRELRASIEEREAHLESCLRKRLHELERQAAQGSQDDALERAEEAVQKRRRLEREHREAADGATNAAREVQELAEACAAGKVASEELAGEEQRLQDQAAQASIRVDQLMAEIKSMAQKKAEVDGRLQSLTAPVADVEKCRQLPKAQLVQELTEAGRQLQSFQHVNRKAVEQYENFSEQLTDLRRRKEEVDRAEASISEALQCIDAQKESTILQTLERVNNHFQHVFTEMVPGGQGKLQIVRQPEGDSATQATQNSLAGDADGDALGGLLGVRIEVSFTGQSNSFLLMNQLSGGQKTVVALSLIFAIQRLEPAPFYLLDEVDAALDASYRSALANLVARTAKSSQVVMTTFRMEAIEKADRCYRVYQQNRASRIDVVSREQAREVLREQDRLAQAAAEIGHQPLAAA